MTDEQWSALEPFAEKHAEASMRLRNLQSTNQPQDERSRISLRLAIERAHIELQQADRAYKDKQKEILGFVV